MRDDEVRAAAERLLVGSIHGITTEALLRDIKVVARAALEAGQETKRLRLEVHRLHITELMQSARERIRIPETEDCPRCAAPFTPGRAESSGE